MSVHVANTQCVIGKFIRNNEDSSNALDECTCSKHSISKQDQWQCYLNGYVEDFVEATCCSKVAHPLLNHGAGSMVKTPKLLKLNYIKGDCELCGVKRKLDIL